MPNDLQPLQVKSTLCSSDLPGFDDSVRAKVFGELVKLTHPILEHYHSDLYHDANWLNTWAKDDLEAISFVYGVDDSHTFIGPNDEETVKIAKGHDDNVWVIDVVHEIDRHGTRFPWVIYIKKVK